MSPASPSSSASSTPVPRLSIRERRQANRKKWRNRAIGVLALAGSLVVAEKQWDISGRVGRALDDRPVALRTFIREFSDTEFVAQRMQENNAYFEKKGVIDKTRRNALAETLTRLDILVQGYSEPDSNITEHDLLAYVLWTDERIATSEGTFLDTIVSIDGVVAEKSGTTIASLLDTSTGFLATVFDDSNNPAKQTRHLTIASRPGGYALTFEHKWHRYNVDVGIRHKK